MTLSVSVPIDGVMDFGGWCEYILGLVIREDIVVI